MAQMQQIRDEIATVKNVLESQTMKFTSLDQEIAAIKDHIAAQIPKFAEFDKMANEWSPQVEAMLGKHDAGHKATIEEQASTLAKLQRLS